MTGPRVYAAISAVTADLARSGIAKSQINSAEQYAYRGIDDVMGRLAPLLAKHRLCILPRVMERTAMERRGVNDALLLSVTLRVAFDIISARDGSAHTIEAYGEALDGGDKATSQAMSAAFKYAVLQAFCIPIQGSEDADATTHRLVAPDRQVDPVQGWEQWSLDIQDMVRVCESGDALDRMQNTYRAELRAASKRRPEIYAAIGDAVRERRQALAAQARPPVNPAPASASRNRSQGNGSLAAGVSAHA
jgi:hypothetical protein